MIVPQLFRPQDGSRVKRPSQPALDASRDREPPDAALICAFCRHPITSLAFRIDVHGAHRHTFANPYGMIFRIGCFSEAPGCRPVGAPSSEFAWFSGHDWQVSLCTRCGLHLGWRFTSAATSFHGLILDRLQDAPLQPPQQP
jgi:hypothetical protein